MSSLNYTAIALNHIEHYPDCWKDWFNDDDEKYDTDMCYYLTKAYFDYKLSKGDYDFFKTLNADKLNRYGDYICSGEFNRESLKYTSTIKELTVSDTMHSSNLLQLFTNLKKITFFNIDDLEFSNDFWKLKIEELVINKCSFSEELIFDLPLSRLELHNLEEIPSFVWNLKSLKELIITKIKCEKMPKGIKKLTNLKILRMNKCEMDLLRNFNELQQLEELYLNDNDLSDTLYLVNLPSLKILDISNNEDLSEIDEGTISTLMNLTTLTTDIDFDDIPDEILNLPFLKTITCYINDVKHTTVFD